MLLAGLPSNLIQRASAILLELEKKQAGSASHTLDSSDLPKFQLSIFDAHTEVFDEIRDLITQVDINMLTPMDALNILNDIKKKIN
jgi:DNA mismatch repair protein MutS